MEQGEPPQKACVKLFEGIFLSPFTAKQKGDTSFVPDNPQ